MKDVGYSLGCCKLIAGFHLANGNSCTQIISIMTIDPPSLINLSYAYVIYCFQGIVWDQY